MNNTERLVTKLKVMKNHLEETNDERCSNAFNEMFDRYGF